MGMAGLDVRVERIRVIGRRVLARVGNIRVDRVDPPVAVLVHFGALDPTVPVQVVQDGVDLGRTDVSGSPIASV